MQEPDKMLSVSPKKQEQAADVLKRLNAEPPKTNIDHMLSDVMDLGFAVAYRVSIIYELRKIDDPRIVQVLSILISSHQPFIREAAKDVLKEKQEALQAKGSLAQTNWKTIIDTCNDEMHQHEIKFLISKFAHLKGAGNVLKELVYHPANIGKNVRQALIKLDGDATAAKRKKEAIDYEFMIGPFLVKEIA